MRCVRAILVMSVFLGGCDCLLPSPTGNGPSPAGQAFYEDWDTTPATPDAMRGWTFFLQSGFENHQASGGNPSGYIRGQFLAAGVPFFGTRDGLVKDYVENKDYQTLGIIGLLFDLNVFENTLMATARQLSVVLRSDGGTPNDFSDDVSVAYVSDTILPLPGSGWQSFQFAIPSQSETLPDGWKMLSSHPGANWLTVIRDVDQIEVTFGDPELVFLLDDMTVGVDNFAVRFLE